MKISTFSSARAGRANPTVCLPKHLTANTSLHKLHVYPYFITTININLNNKEVYYEIRFKVFISNICCAVQIWEKWTMSPLKSIKWEGKSYKILTDVCLCVPAVF